MSDLLDLVLAAHGGLELWREVRYLDVRLSASGGLFQIKGHPEGLHDVIMRIETQTACSHLCSLWASRLPRPLHSNPRVDRRSRGSCRRGTCRPSCVVRRPRPRDTLGSATAALFHGLRQLELLHRSVFAHTVWCRRPRDGAT